MKKLYLPTVLFLIGTVGLFVGCSSQEAQTGPPDTAAARLQLAMARYGSLRAMAQIPERLRPGAALAVLEMKERPELVELDVEQLELRPGPEIDGAQQLTVRQRVGRVPVFGAVVRVSFNDKTLLASVNGELVAGLRLKTQPTLERDAAIDRALAAVGCAQCGREAARSWLMVLRRDGTDHLVYRVWPRNGAGPEPHPMVFVDAHSGDIVWKCADHDTPACFDRE